MTSLLTADEIERLMIGLAYHKGVEGFDVVEAATVVTWAEETRVRARVLSMLLGDEPAPFDVVSAHHASAHRSPRSASARRVEDDRPQP